MGLGHKIRGIFGKKEINGKKVLCYCKKVTEEKVVKAIRQGASSVEEVGKVTKAGTGCGACQRRIQELIDENK